MICLRNISKKYPDNYALFDVSFDVSKGEILGLLGPNGAGKTTTMRVIVGSIAPTSGEVSIAGMDILSNPKDIKKLIGYMPENNPLCNDLKVSEYLKFRGKLKGCSGKRLKERMDYVADKCMVGDVFHRMISALSKGYRQRVGLAETLIHDPQVLILDEPTVGLDPTQIRQVRDLIKSIGKDRTVILSTHILPEVEATCDRVVIINKGKIQAVDTTENLRKTRQGAGRIRVEIKNNTDKFESLLNASGFIWVCKEKLSVNHALYHIDVSADTDIRESIFNAVVDNKSILLEMHQEKVTLEDIFIEIVTEEEEINKGTEL